jgi:hypothetical protein
MIHIERDGSRYDDRGSGYASAPPARGSREAKGRAAHAALPPAAPPKEEKPAAPPPSGTNGHAWSCAAWGSASQTLCDCGHIQPIQPAAAPATAPSKRVTAAKRAAAKLAQQAAYEAAEILARQQEEETDETEDDGPKPIPIIQREALDKYLASAERNPDEAFREAFTPNRFGEYA